MKIKHLDENKRGIIYNLVHEFGLVFRKHQFEIGIVKEHEACIILLEDCYVAKKLYCCSIDDQREIERQVTELLKHGMTKELCSPCV